MVSSANYTNNFVEEYKIILLCFVVLLILKILLSCVVSESRVRKCETFGPWTFDTMIPVPCERPPTGRTLVSFIHDIDFVGYEKGIFQLPDELENCFVMMFQLLQLILNKMLDLTVRATFITIR